MATTFVNTSGSNEAEWVLTTGGVAERIKQVAASGGVDLLDVAPGHSNLPSNFILFYRDGTQSTIVIRSTTAATVDAEIRSSLGLAPVGAHKAAAKAEADEEEDEVTFTPSASFEKAVETTPSKEEKKK